MVRRAPYFYLFENVSGGIDLDASPGVEENAGEDEVVFPGGIDIRYVVGAWEYDGNDQVVKWIPKIQFGNVG